MKEKEKSRYFYGYRYYCDRCGKEISFEDYTMKQVYIQQTYNRKKKLYDLCNNCYKSFVRGVEKK